MISLCSCHHVDKLLFWGGCLKITAVMKDFSRLCIQVSFLSRFGDLFRATGIKTGSAACKTSMLPAVFFSLSRSIQTFTLVILVMALAL